MDPYKVLGVSANNIKNESDLNPARKRAKLLFKRLTDEKKKFEAKKVLEAFEMIKRNLKGKVGEGQYKLIGRSRKERELDKHFNHQTKEIKKDKRTMKALEQARHGEKRVRLRGDKEKVARPSHRRDRRNKRRKKKVDAKKHVDALQGLEKLSKFLESKNKFPKTVPLLNRWAREYMNQDNRGHAFEVLQKLATSEYLTDDLDSRQQVIQVFEYVMNYFSAWFEEDESHLMLRQTWRTGCVLACHCFTDDAFMLTRTITSLNETLTLLETNKDKLEEQELEPKASPGTDDFPTGPLSPGALLGSPSLSDDEGGADGGDEEPMEFYPDMSSDEDGDFEGEIKEEVEVKVETKVEIKEEKLVETKFEDKDKKDVKMEGKKERPKKAAVEISLDSDDDGIVKDVDEEEVIDSEESVHDIDSGGLDDSDEVYESLSSGELEDSDGVEYVDASFKAPSVSAGLKKIREHFVFRCLETLFSQRGPQWARPKIDAFFQDVYYRRAILTPGQQLQLEAWQARIKVTQRGAERVLGEANNPMEAHRPVIDSRETINVTEADGGAWCAKQTFDSRDKCGGSNVIR